MFNRIWVGVKLNEERDVLDNPWRGFYTIHKFWAHENSGMNEFFQKSQSLSLVEINLAAFSLTKLSDDALVRVDAIFGYFTHHRREMIVRFLYDWDGDGLKYEPLDIKLVLEHMGQLAPLMRKYEKNIYIHQGLFVGSWGEMHTSRHLSGPDVEELAGTLSESVGESTYIALRSPSYWRQIFKTYDPSDTRQGIGKFCLYNDAILASPTDYGTYGNIPRTASRCYSDKLTRDEEIDFQNKLCLRVPNGGEVIGETAQNIHIAISTLKRSRISYLNSTYDPGVIDAWKNTKAGVGGRFWRSRSAYDYFAAHLGYRFLIISTSCRKKREGFMLQVKIKNTGFSSCYIKFSVQIVIITLEGIERRYPLDADTDTWYPGNTIRLNTLIDATGIIGIRIHDVMTNKIIQFANLPLNDSGYQIIGELKGKH